MARKSVSKMYRKIVNESDDYKRFTYIERLHPNEAKDVLMAISINLLPTLHNPGNSEKRIKQVKEKYQVLAADDTKVIERDLLTFDEMAEWVNQRLHCHKIYIFNSRQELLLRMEFGALKVIGDSDFVLNLMNHLNTLSGINNGQETLRLTGSGAY